MKPALSRGCEDWQAMDVPSRTDLYRTAGIAALGVALLAVVAAVDRLGDLTQSNASYISLFAAGLVVCGLATLLLWNRARRRDLAIVLVIALAARIILLGSEPTLSDDAYRFVWDGRVQAEGINPYRYVPADERLTELRDFEVFTQINRAFTTTLYPPANEVSFFAFHELIGDGITEVKLGLLGLEALTVVVLLCLLTRVGVSWGRVALYVWHPLAIVEVAGNAHPEPMLISLLLASLLAWDRGRSARAGIALGAAALTKFVPVLVAPFMFRRLGWRFAAAGLGIVALLYAPYLGAGSAAFGSVNDYTAENFGSGPFRWLTSLGAPEGPARALLLCGLVAAVAASAIRPPRDTVAACRCTVLLFGAALLASHNVQPWYLLWVLPLLCVAPNPAMLWATGAVSLYYLVGSDHPVADAGLVRAAVWGPTVLMLIASATPLWSRWAPRAEAGEARAPA